MSESIKHYLYNLIDAFGRTTPPINPEVLRKLHERKDYASMLGWIKNSMHIDLRVGMRIVESVAPSAPMWIETPKIMPPYGSSEFKRTRVVVNVRRDLLQTKPFEWVVSGFAHELSHVVLFSIGHKLQHEEKAVDLTAMILGYQNFIASAENTTTKGRLVSILLALLFAPLG